MPAPRLARPPPLRQDMLLRALQGTYTAYARTHDISGEAVALFALACAQIMYAFAMCPDTLSRSYRSWCGPPPFPRAHR